MKIDQFDFGSTRDGILVKGMTLRNAGGMSLAVINWGATLVSVKVPDRHGRVEEITLTLDSFEDYEAHSPYFGSTVGRVANRIAAGRFCIGDVIYRLEKNENGINHLHGGRRGISRVMWQIEGETVKNAASVRCRCLSKDGEEGYPGDFNVVVAYTLTEENELIIEYTATTTRTCPVNLTNHAYWNLSGNCKHSILEHLLQIDCASFLPVDGNLIPTGEIRPVAGTPWDFRVPKRIGKDIDQAGGYDHCYVSSTEKRRCSKVATVWDPASGREMTVFTTEPGVQFYSGNFLHNNQEQGFSDYEGLCLETQGFPDAVNQEKFPSILLNPGEVYRQKTIHRFSIK